MGCLLGDLGEGKKKKKPSRMPQFVLRTWTEGGLRILSTTECDAHKKPEYSEEEKEKGKKFRHPFGLLLEGGKGGRKLREAVKSKGSKGGERPGHTFLNPFQHAVRKKRRKKEKFVNPVGA